MRNPPRPSFLAGTRLASLATVRLGLAALAGFLAVNGSCADAASVSAAYRACLFAPGEGWRITAAGNAGATRLDARTFHFDFTHGASSVGLSLPDRSLLTRPERFRLHVRGEAKGHPVRVAFHTHFMTFFKVVGDFTGAGEQELVFAAPPGEGWQFSGGENDGKIHGPLRLAEIRFEANGHADQGALELLDLAVEGQCPSNKLCALTATTTSSEAGSSFTASLQSVADRVLEGELVWTIRDWDGHVLGEGQTPLALPPDGVRTNVTVPAARFAPSLRFAEAEFRLQLPGQSVAPVQAYWLAPVPPNENARLQPESAFGMGVYLGRFGPAAMQEVARKARDAGVKWSREDFSWGRLEPRRGEFHWDYYDQLLDCARRNGITVYAIIGYWTGWTKPYTTEGIEDYVRFTRALVAHYQDRIHQWEIWNEPNIFFWQGPKEMYAELLTKSFHAIKEVDPQAQVLGLSTSGVDFKFIEQVLAQQAPFDVLTVHPYRRLLKEDDFIRDLKKASDLVRLADGARRPVWITEMGWATHVPHHALRQDFESNTQRAQAELIARTYLSTIASGVEPRTFWYDFRDDGDDPFYFEHNMGVLRADGRPKPAYIAYATMTRLLNDMQFVRARNDWPDVYACEFAARGGGAGRVLALWRTAAEGEVEVPVSAGTTTLLNTMGEAHPVSVAGGKCKIPLRANSPVYLLIP